MSLKFERKLPIILFFVFLMLTTIGFVFYQNTVSLQQAIEWQKRTQEVLLKLDETLTLTLDIEAGVRGFIVTGNDTYLDPYNRARQKIPQNVAQLRALTAGNAEQAAELDRLEVFLKANTEDAARKVDLRKSEGYEQAILEVPGAQSKIQTESIRTSIERLKAAELGQLQQREQRLDNGLYWTIWILIISSLAGIISLAWANFVVWREIKKRRSAETALLDANHELEEKIEERTTELKEANESLHEIAGERELLLVNEKSARKEAEIANRLRDEFMASVSHELRTPLNSILGWARLMKDAALDSVQSAKAVNTIIKNSETQNRLIEDLLDVARIVSGKLELELAPIDPTEPVIHSIDSLRPSAGSKDVSIDLLIDDKARNVIIRGDDSRLRQIFSNLLTNAIKFSPRNASIDVDVTRNGEFVDISVADNGIGINRDFLPMVFERFRQDTSAARKMGGLGLGLAIVRNLVELHGGSVSVESEGENRGSTFTVKLPVFENGKPP